MSIEEIIVNGLLTPQIVVPINWSKKAGTISEEDGKKIKQS